MARSAHHYVAARRTEPKPVDPALVGNRVVINTQESARELRHPDKYIASTKSVKASKVTEFERHVRSVYRQMVRISIEP